MPTRVTGPTTLTGPKNNHRNRYKLMAATLQADTIKNASSATANITLDTAGNATVGNTLAMGSSFLRNRIINGDMRIDQRNAGAATANTISGYTLDRWAVYQSVTGKIIVQQNAGSATPPAGFKNYIGVTSQSSYSVSSSDIYQLYQPIEGFNTADLNWGTANAQTVTLSFWVKSSLTGTFGGSLYSGGATTARSYPFTYNISNTNWNYITITIPGDTFTNTWNTTNGGGVTVNFSLGAGSTYNGPANTWQTGIYTQVSGNTSIVGTNGATFYITGVQLEVGSVATPFERRQYGQELALCQRYYYQSWGNSNAVYAGNAFFGYTKTTTSAEGYASYPVSMRAAPTITLYDGALNQGKATQPAVANNLTAAAAFIGFNGFAGLTGSGYTANTSIFANFSASIEL